MAVAGIVNRNPNQTRQDGTMPIIAYAAEPGLTSTMRRRVFPGS